MLDRVDVHCVWVSQAVLDLLPADVPDVPGGEVVRTPGMGVFCDNAIDLVYALWPRPSRDKKRTFVRDAMRRLHAVGLVGMHDAGNVPEDLALFRDMAEEAAAAATATAAAASAPEAVPAAAAAAADDEPDHEWTMRVFAMLECKPRNAFCPDEAASLRQETDLLTIRSVKLFAGKKYSVYFLVLPPRSLASPR